MIKTISVRQLSIIGFISVFALKLTILPSLFYQKSGIDALFSLFFLIIFDLLEYFIILKLLKQNQNKDFYQFLCDKTGKIVAKIILFLLFVFYFIKIILLTSGGYNFARNAIFKEAPLFLFAFILLSISNSLCLFKTQSYARTSEFFYPIILIMMSIFMIIALFTAPMQDLRPFFQNTFSNIFNTSFMFSIVSGNFLFMLFFMGRIKFKETKYKSYNFKILYGCFLVFLFYFIDYSIFKYTAMAHPQAISEIIQFLPLTNIIGNFDWLAVSLMLLLFSLHGGLFIICLSYSLKNILVNKKIKNKNLLSLIIINFLILIFIYFVFPKFEDMRQFVFNQYYVPILSSIVFFIPLFLYIISFIIEKINKKNRVILKRKKGITNINFKNKGMYYEKDF